MRLSLRTLLAFEDNVFDMEQHRQLERTIPAHEPAARALSRIRDVVRDPRLGVPGTVDRHEELDPNLVAEYLDHQMSPEYLEQFEGYCFSEDKYLAEVASVHQIVSNVLGEPARTNRDCRLRCYHLYRKEADRTETPALTVRYAEPETRTPPLKEVVYPMFEERTSVLTARESEKTVASPTRNNQKFYWLIILLLIVILLGVLAFGLLRSRQDTNAFQLDRKEKRVVFSPPSELPSPAPVAVTPIKVEAASVPTAEPKKKAEPIPATGTAQAKSKPKPAAPTAPKTKPEQALVLPTEVKTKPEQALTSPVKPKAKPEPATEIADADPFLQAAPAAPPAPVAASDSVAQAAPLTEDPWKTSFPFPPSEPKNVAESKVVHSSDPFSGPSANPLREADAASVAPDHKRSKASIALAAVEEKKPSGQAAPESPKSASNPAPIPSFQAGIPEPAPLPFSKPAAEPFKEESEVSFQGISHPSVGSESRADFRAESPERLQASPHRLEYQSIVHPPPPQVAAAPVPKPVETSPLRQTSLIIPMGGLAEQKPKPLTAGNPLKAPNLRCCVMESSEPCVVFTAVSAESPWSMETKELNLRSNQYLLTAAPFRADLELGAFQVEMIGDSKLCILPPDEKGVPGLFLDYGRLVIRLREGETGKSDRSLRIQTEKTEGLVSIDGPRSLVFLDTFAEIIESSGNVRESSTLGAPVRTDAILGLLPDPAESVSWRSKDREKPLVTSREMSVLLAEGRSDEGSIRNHPNWLRRLSLSPECRELEAACHRAFERHPDNCEAALQELIQDSSPAVRSYGFRLWGDLGRFDIPLARMSQLDETEEPLRKILVGYFREVMKRDGETVQRLADAIDAARR